MQFKCKTRNFNWRLWTKLLYYMKLNCNWRNINIIIKQTVRFEYFIVSFVGNGWSLRDHWGMGFLFLILSKPFNLRLFTFLFLALYGCKIQPSWSDIRGLSPSLQNTTPLSKPPGLLFQCVLDHCPSVLWGTESTLMYLAETKVYNTYFQTTNKTSETQYMRMNSLF